MKLNRSRRMRGFTLVELLVVIAIIGVLVALLLPAVQAAREAARRMQCSNNLKQLGLALHNHHDIYDEFPAAFSSDPGPGAGDDDLGSENSHGNWGWATMLFPFIEQEPLFDQLDPENRFLHEAAADGNLLPLMQQELTGFRCPSDPGPELNSFHTVPTGGGDEVEVALSNYIASNDHSNLRRVDPSGMFGWGYPGGGNENSMITRSMASITDGTSNTIAVGERTWMLNSLELRAGVVFGCDGNQPQANENGLVMVAGSGGWPINCTNEDNCRRGFSSQHPGGAQFLLADGSVRFISENVDHDPATDAVDSTFEALIGVQDGMPVSVD